MKTIELTQGKVAMVDDEDFEELNKYKWCVNKIGNAFYAMGSTRGVKPRTAISMHRAITNAPKGMMVDHIDGDGLNNCRSNLRIVTNRQNMQNMHISKSSIYPGVDWQKDRGKWQSRISIKGKSKYLGRFDVEADAYAAYLKALEGISEMCVNEIPLRGNLPN